MNPKCTFFRSLMAPFLALCIFLGNAIAQNGGGDNPCLPTGSAPDSYHYWEDDPNKDPTCDWVLLEVDSVDPDVDAILKDSGDSVTITAAPDPDDESFHQVEWERKKDSGSWSSVAGTSDSVTLDDSSEGIYVYRARHGPSGAWVETGDIYVVEAEITPSGETQDGAKSDQFEVETKPSSITVDAYEWKYTVPSGAGRAPTSNIFDDKTSATPVVSKAQWFAPTGSSDRNVDGPECSYEIECDITVAGETLSVEKVDWTVYVYKTSPTTNVPKLSRYGRTVLSYSLNQDENYPNVFVNEVRGHNMTRSSPSINENGMASSNTFYSKIIDGHEGRHVEQWTLISPYSELFQPSKIYDLFSGESKSGSVSEVIEWQKALESEALALYKQYMKQCNRFRSETADCREQDAHAKSNAIAPNYLNANLSSEYQNCPSPMPSPPKPQRSN